MTALTDSEGRTLSTDSVAWESGVDSRTPGTYEIHYEVSDGQGNTGETWMTVVVRE